MKTEVMSRPSADLFAGKVVIELSSIVEAIEQGHMNPRGILTAKLEALIGSAGETGESLRIYLRGDDFWVNGTKALVEDKWSSSIQLFIELLGEAGLFGLELPLPLPAHTLMLWLTSLVGGMGFKSDVFEEIGLRGLERHGRGQSTLSLTLPGIEPKIVAGAEVLPSSSPRSSGSYRRLGADAETKPDRVVRKPKPREAETLVSGPPPGVVDWAPLHTAEQERLTVTAPASGASLNGTKKALVLLFEAADRFELVLDSLRSDNGVTKAQWAAFQNAAIKLQRATDEHPSLTLSTHRIRCRTSPMLQPHAIHAASTAALVSVMARGVGLSRDASDALARAALFAHLPLALEGRPPSPAPLPDGNLAAANQSLKARLGQGANVENLAWRTAREFRSGIYRDDGQMTQATSRLVAVAAAYDMMTTKGPASLGMSPSDALRSLKSNPETFDAQLVEVLAVLQTELG